YPRLVAAGERRPRDLADLPPGGVCNLQLHLADLLLVEPGEARRLRRVLAVEGLIAPELVVAIARRTAIHRERRRREQARVGGCRLRRRVLLNRLPVIQG